MKLIFTIKYITDGLIKGGATGSLAMIHDPYPNARTHYLLDRFRNKVQEQRFVRAGSRWKPIKIKKLT